MAHLWQVVGSVTPVTPQGSEFGAVCPFEPDGRISVIGERWLCVAHGCHERHGADALGFLRCAGVPEDTAKERLANGHDWEPTLTLPEIPPSPYALARLQGTPLTGRVLVVDSRKAARRAEELLRGHYTALVAWPDGGERWEIEPLRGRAVLLWYGPDSATDFKELELRLTAPSQQGGLGCTGKTLTEPNNLTEWSGTKEELISWAKSHVRALREPQEPMASDAPIRPVDTKKPRKPRKSLPERSEAPKDDAVAAPEPIMTPVKPEAYRGQANGRPVGVGDIDWLSILEQTKQGPLNNLDNVVRVIENDPSLRGHIWYDEFLDSICSDWQGESRRWRDSDDVLLQLYVQRHVGINRIGVNTVHDAALVAAFRNVRNECREWLESRKWDETPRLTHVLSDAFGAKHNPYSEAVGRCWFVSMVARVMEPGCKVDTVPVLEGAQGVGKSSALKIIGGKWFIECHESVLTKDWYGVLDGHMLVEISEMHSFTRGEVERVKGLISCQVDRYRRAYGRNTEDHPRQSVLVCTTNRDDWQRDETGARRFWPVLCGAINLDWLHTNRDNLFAEAIHLYRNGVVWWDVPEQDQKDELEQRRDADAWEPAVTAWAKERDRFTTSEVLSNCLDIDLSKQDVIYQRRVARILRSVGLSQHVKRENGVNTRVWIRHP